MPDERLDVRLAREAGVTRSRAEKLIREGRASVDGRVERKPGARVAPGASLLVEMPPPQPIEALPEPLPLSILYEDAHMAVIDKPAGMVVHPGAGNACGTLVNALLYHLDGLSGIGGAIRPGIVHRLDKDTSGLLLVAKDDAAHQALSAALKKREIRKVYRAVAVGRFREEAGVIEAPIARHPTNRKRMAVVPGGRYARTEYRADRELRGASLLTVELITGRTHQIRVHLAHVGHPVAGDAVYGGATPRLKAPRLMLHARSLELNHPVTGERLRFEAPEPREFLDFVETLLP